MLTLFAGELSAQRAVEPSLTRHSARVALAGDRPTRVSVAPAASYGRPVAGALLGGAAGALAGGIAGLYIGGNRCSEPANSDTCQGLEGLVVGSALGITLGAPLGAHLLNGRRGSLPLSMLGSAAVGGLGVLAILAVEQNVEGSRQGGIQVPLAVATPVLQVITAAIIERRTSVR
jgi:hypothetical protein